MKKYYIFSFFGVLILSFYPLYMGARVIFDMLKNASVSGENYPKYLIPYTPISLAVIVGVILLPLFVRLFKKYSLAALSAVSLAVFFLSELLFENLVIVTDTVTTKLESWQMYMCYVPPEKFVTRVQKPIDVLIGEYSPTFKLHFYIIAVIIILTVLNCLHGFALILKTKNAKRKKPLVMQAAASAVFLSLCILACFTAFFRSGELTVSPLSAVLMCIFFICFGACVGIYIGSFLIGKEKLISTVLPAIFASLATLLMYLGENFLLSGELYRFGSGFFFNGIGIIAIAPIDIIVVLLSGAVTFFVLRIASKSKP